MVGYSYVDVAQPNTKYYQPGSPYQQQSSISTHSQQLAPQPAQQNTQFYDLFMNQLLESAIQRPAVAVQPVAPIQSKFKKSKKSKNRHFRKKYVFTTVRSD